jgi:DNA topoisomerase-1
MLSKFFGAGFQVEATMGHIRDLPEKKFGVDISVNGQAKVVPQYEISAGKAQRVQTLKSLAKPAAKIILATDPDREGEAIAWHSAVLLNGANQKSEIRNPKFSRVVFHQITKGAILEAMDHPRQIDMRLVDAQQARRVLDRVVGYKLSPLLWKKIRRGLSAGRVQSVAVRLIVDREREIAAFIPEEFWEIFVELSKTPQNFIVKLTEIDGKKAALSKKDQADPVVADLPTAGYAVDSVDKKEVRRSPWPPFTTSTLQQAASRILRFTGKKTMSVAQALYEHGFITYHRTDSLNLAPEAIAAARTLIPQKYGPDFLSPRPRVYKTKTKLAQEAHEAIRPTNLSQIDNLNEINLAAGQFGRDAVRLYDLIWKRFVAGQMADQIYDQTTIVVKASGSKIYRLSVTGQVEKFAGWKIISRTVLAEQGQSLIVFPGDPLQFIKLDPQQKFTLAPARYTEAMLIKALEARGIGRPSTYAPTISTIEVRGYVERKEAKFHPTAVGMVVTDFLVKYFSDIVDYDFTAEMETDLDRIAAGEKDWQKVIGVFWTPFMEKLGKIENTAARQSIPAETTGQKCPDCQEGDQVIRSGKFGKFLSCSRFPQCKWKAKFTETTGQKCPDCRQGDVVIRKTKKGKLFYGCSKYPACKWASWRKPKSNEQKTGNNEQ